MTVTELARFHTLSGNLSPALRDLLTSAIEVQDKWCAANLPATDYMVKGPEKRGAALFQQVEDPAVLLLTAHWDSVEQHLEWIGSEENQEAYPLIQEHLDMSKFLFFHLDQIAAIGTEVLDAKVVNVTRYFVPQDKKKSIDGAVSALSDGGDVIEKGGWRIEKDEISQKTVAEEYVIVTAVNDVGNLEDAGGQTEQIFKKLTSGEETRHYRRVL